MVEGGVYVILSTTKTLKNKNKNKKKRSFEMQTKPKKTQRQIPVPWDKGNRPPPQGAEPTAQVAELYAEKCPSRPAM